MSSKSIVHCYYVWCLLTVVSAQDHVLGATLDAFHVIRNHFADILSLVCIVHGVFDIIANPCHA